MTLVKVLSSACHVHHLEIPPQDYESAANYISTFFELEARLAGHAQRHGGSILEDGQEDAQRKVRRES